MKNNFVGATLAVAQNDAIVRNKRTGLECRTSRTRNRDNGQGQALPLRDVAESCRYGRDCLTLHVIDIFRMLTAVSKTMMLEFHGHNDLGMATANAICAVIAGTRTLSVTVNGLGERAGNTPLEEIALALPVSTGKFCHIHPDKLQPLGNFVARISNREIPVNKPVTGSHIFTHESGIHCHALIKDDLSYQPYPPAMVCRKTEFVLGKIFRLDDSSSCFSTSEIKNHPATTSLKQYLHWTTGNRIIYSK